MDNQKIEALIEELRGEIKEAKKDFELAKTDFEHGFSLGRGSAKEKMFKTLRKLLEEEK